MLKLTNHLSDGNGTRSTINYFDSISEEYNKFTSIKSEFTERYKIWFLKIDQYKSNSLKHALDIGCGNGIITQYLLKYYDTVALDGSSKMLEIVSSTLASYITEGKLELIQTNLPFDDEFTKVNQNKFGFITLSSVIEYIDEDELLLKQIFEILSFNGILLISFPNKSSLYRKFEIFFIKKYHRHSYLKFVKKFYDRGYFDNIVKQMGYKIVDEEYYALPKSKFFKLFFGKYRPKWFASLRMVTLTK